MNFDSMLGLAALVLSWRVTLSIACGVVCAVLLTSTVPWITSLQGIAIALFATAFGIAWESRVTMEGKTNDQQPPETSAAVYRASSMLTGAVWGAFSASSLYSILAGLALLLLCVSGWVWDAHRRKQRVVRKFRLLCFALAVLGYTAASWVGHILP